MPLGGPLSRSSLNPSWSKDRFLPLLSGGPFQGSSPRPRSKSKPCCPRGRGGGLRLISGRIAGLFSFVSEGFCSCLGGGPPGPLIMRGSLDSSRCGARGSRGDPQLSRRLKRPGGSSGPLPCEGSSEGPPHLGSLFSCIP